MIAPLIAILLPALAAGTFVAGPELNGIVQMGRAYLARHPGQSP